MTFENIYIYRLFPNYGLVQFQGAIGQFYSWKLPK